MRVILRVEQIPSLSSKLAPARKLSRNLSDGRGDSAHAGHSASSAGTRPSETG
jgi:hypothetical protein